MNSQEQYWIGSGGDDYTKRNDTFRDIEYVTDTRLNVLKRFFSEIPKDSSILEIGCNRGNTIQILKDMGFSNITGIDINESALSIIREKFPEFKFYNSSIEEYYSTPYDLVITCGVLIHIHPDNLDKVIDRIENLSSKYIFGYEYYSDTLKKMPYHDKGEVWSGDYENMFHVKPQKIELHYVKHHEKALTHVFYLLKK